MPKRSSKDENEIAASIVQHTVGEESARKKPKPKKAKVSHTKKAKVTRTKNAAAVALGRLGGKKGGPARAAKLSPRRRKEIAKKAAQARWKSQKKSNS